MRLIYTSPISPGDKLGPVQGLLEVTRPLDTLAQKGIISLLSITSVGDSPFIYFVAGFFTPMDFLLTQHEAEFAW